MNVHRLCRAWSAPTLVAFAAYPGSFSMLGGDDVWVAGVGVAPAEVVVQGAGGHGVIGVIGSGYDEGA